MRAWIFCVVGVAVGLALASLIGQLTRADAAAAAAKAPATWVTNDINPTTGNPIPLQVRETNMMAWQYDRFEVGKVPPNNKSIPTPPVDPHQDPYEQLVTAWLTELGRQNWEPCFQIDNPKDVSKTTGHLFRSRTQ